MVRKVMRKGNELWQMNQNSRGHAAGENTHLFWTVHVYEPAKIVTTEWRQACALFMHFNAWLWMQLPRVQVWVELSRLPVLQNIGSSVWGFAQSDFQGQTWIKKLSARCKQAGDCCLCSKTVNWKRDFWIWLKNHRVSRGATRSSSCVTRKQQVTSVEDESVHWRLSWWAWHWKVHEWENEWMNEWGPKLCFF